MKNSNKLLDFIKQMCEVNGKHKRYRSKASQLLSYRNCAYVDVQVKTNSGYPHITTYHILGELCVILCALRDHKL